jgi:glycosyltransferase involved in cell wall biosynthesis
VEFYASKCSLVFVASLSVNIYLTIYFSYQWLSYLLIQFGCEILKYLLQVMNPLSGVSVQTYPYILCVGDGWFPNRPGGLNRYVYELVHKLSAEGDRVELCGLGLPETGVNSCLKLTNLAAPEHSLGRRFLSTRTNFSKTRSSKPDAVNLHFALYSLPLLPSLPKDVPITFTFHGPWALESERETTNQLSIWAKQWMERQVYRQCDRFIVLSKAFGEILHQHYHIPWNKIYVIPGGVDTQRFQPNLSKQVAREQLGWVKDRFILFTPRRLVQRMGIDNLLTALASIKSKYPDVWLAIAGKGKLQESLEQQVAALGLENHVKFLGYLPDEQLPVAYQAADLTVVPSVALEGFGLILLESLASGTPVMCTPVGGMPEVLTGFSPELITTSTDANALVNCLENVLSNQMSLPSQNACFDYAASHFSWNTIAQKVRNILLASH